MEINNNTCVFPMTLDQFCQILDNDNHPYEDLIVTIKYKYDWETEYITENQFLEYDGNRNAYVWLHDWDEGQTDVTVLGCIPVSDVNTISERSETHLPTRNIDYIRSLPVEELANYVGTMCLSCYFAGLNENDDGCKDCQIKEICPRNNSVMMFEEWLLSERSETNLPNRNIDYIRSLPVEELANLIHHWIYCCEEGDCGKCPLFEMPHACTVDGVKEWLLSECSEKEDSHE